MYNIHTYVTHIDVVWVEEKLYLTWLGLAATLIFSQQHVYYRLRGPSPLSLNTWLPKHINPSTNTSKICFSIYALSLNVLNRCIPTSQQSINSYDERIAIGDLHVMNTEQFLVNFWLQCKHFSCILCTLVWLYECECVWVWVIEWASACTVVVTYTMR